jgi:hypothetical protein
MHIWRTCRSVRRRSIPRHSIPAGSLNQRDAGRLKADHRDKADGQRGKAGIFQKGHGWGQALSF